MTLHSGVILKSFQIIDTFRSQLPPQTIQAHQSNFSPGPSDVIDAQLGVDQSYTVRTLGGLVHQYLQYGLNTGIYRMVYTVALLK